MLHKSPSGMRATTTTHHPHHLSPPTKQQRQNRTAITRIIKIQIRQQSTPDPPSTPSTTTLWHFCGILTVEDLFFFVHYLNNPPWRGGRSTHSPEMTFANIVADPAGDCWLMIMMDGGGVRMRSVKQNDDNNKKLWNIINEELYLGALGLDIQYGLAGDSGFCCHLGVDANRCLGGKIFYLC